MYILSVLRSHLNSFILPHSLDIPLPKFQKHLTIIDVFLPEYQIFNSLLVFRSLPWFDTRKARFVPLIFILFSVQFWSISRSILLLFTHNFQSIFNYNNHQKFLGHCPDFIIYKKSTILSSISPYARKKFPLSSFSLHDLHC